MSDRVTQKVSEKLKERAEAKGERLNSYETRKVLEDTAREENIVPSQESITVETPKETMSAYDSAKAIIGNKLRLNDELRGKLSTIEDGQAIIKRILEENRAERSSVKENLDNVYN